jgi:hypothetical protein
MEMEVRYGENLPFRITTLEGSYLPNVVVEVLKTRRDAGFY